MDEIIEAVNAFIALQEQSEIVVPNWFGFIKETFIVVPNVGRRSQLVNELKHALIVGKLSMGWEK